MRGPTAQEILNIQPQDLRANAKTTQAYLDVRRKILTGEYKTNQAITLKAIDEEYQISNASTQIILLRLAGEGLIKIQPIKERIGSNNAAVNEYRVSNISIRQRIFSSRQAGFITDISKQDDTARSEVKMVETQYADSEIATLLNITEGENIIFLRTYQYQNPDTLIAISDTYLPFWFAEIMPELYKPNTDLYQLAIKLGKNPSWCTETVDIVQSTIPEREIFGMSTDDPSALIKILRCAFDEEGNPLVLDFLTDRGDKYRLHYSFPLFASRIPEKLRNK